LVAEAGARATTSVYAYNGLSALKSSLPLSFQRVSNYLFGGTPEWLDKNESINADVRDADVRASMI